MEKYYETLGECPLFAGIPAAGFPEVLDRLGARVLSYPKGRPVFSEGDPVEYLGMVLSGTVQIARDDYYGNRSILALAEPPDLFGEAFACAGLGTSPVSAVPVCQSEIMLLPCRRLLAEEDGGAWRPRLVKNLLRVVAAKNLVLSQKIEITAKRTTREKLLAFLLAQAKRSGGREFTIPYDRQALADYLAVDRSAMSAEIGRLRREGIIQCKRSWFRLL